MPIESGDPIKVKDAPTFTTVSANNKGGPKYGHLSALDPAFAELKPGLDAAFAAIWKADNWTQFRANWVTDGPLPPGCPEPGKDVSEAYRKIRVRDGAEIELKIMKAVANTLTTGNACILRIHGGGCAIGGHQTEQVENLHAASQPNTVLVSVDYRLAPEHRYPAAINDCVDALKWVKANAAELGVNPDKIILIGSSAGSGLALGVSLVARKENISGVVAMVLDWPTSCHPKFFPQLRAQGYELESYAQNHDASVVTATQMEYFLDAYIPDPQPDEGHSPLLAATFKGLPSALIQVAGYDPLRDEGLAVAEKLKADGVPVELYTYAGLPHIFSAIFPHLPQSKLFQDRQTAFLNKVING